MAHARPLEPLRDDRRRRRLGVVLVAGAVVAWSTTGLFVRAVGLDAWTILFWRGLFGALAIAAALAALHGRGVGAACRGVGAAGLLVALLDVAVTITYVAALASTAVADVAVIYATVPLATALLARLWLGERATPAVLAASLAAAAGVAVMVGGPAGRDGEAQGRLLAAAMTLLTAAMIVVLRRHPGVPMAPTALLSAAATAAIAAPLTSAATPDGPTLALLALFGGVQMTLGLLFFMAGARRVPPAQSALLTCLEAPLAPLLVWLALGELPGPATVLGGGIVLAAVAGHLLAEARPPRLSPRPARPRPAATAPPPAARPARSA